MSLSPKLTNVALLEQPQPQYNPDSKDIVMELANWIPLGDKASPLISDCEMRVRMGAQKYGARLRSHNGRIALVDLYQELLDAINYAYQLKLEGLDDGMLCRKTMKLAMAVRERITALQKKEGQ